MKDAPYGVIRNIVLNIVRAVVAFVGAVTLIAMSRAFTGSRMRA